MATRFLRGPHPAELGSSVPPGGSLLGRMRWWLVAPALCVGAALGAVGWIRTRNVTFDDLSARYAGTEHHRAPWFLWLRDGPDGPVVATAPGGPALAGPWTRSGGRLQGTVPLPSKGPAAATGWDGRCCGPSTTVDGAAWSRWRRQACPADLESLGRDAALCGHWNGSSDGTGWVDLRADGAMVEQDGHEVGRWAGDGGVIVTCEDQAWSGLELLVYVESDEDPADRGADVHTLFIADTGGCERYVLFRRSR